MNSQSQPIQTNRIETRVLTIGELRRMLEALHPSLDSLKVADASWNPVMLFHEEGWREPEIAGVTGFVKLFIS